MVAAFLWRGAAAASGRGGDQSAIMRARAFSDGAAFWQSL